MRLEDVADRVLASAPVRAVALTATGSRLRILAYHGVDRPDVLVSQLHWIKRHLVPVTLADVVSGASLPPRAVLLTFDDGEPSVVERGLPLMRHHGIRPTMFVCPAVIGTDHPLWWQAVPDATTIARLKTVPDSVRRAEIASLVEHTTVRQLTVDELRAFAEHGDVGNHTWDHPMLDRCDDDEQRRQVRDAHTWLGDTLGRKPIAFAYPNGNVAPVARDELRLLGYQLAVLHDHHVVRWGGDGLAMSRLFAGDHISQARFSAIASGAHPFLHAIRGRAR